MTATITPYRSGQQAGHDGFAQVLRAEWTKFRTMRGWVITLLAAAVATALAPIALAGTAKSNDPMTCVHGQCQVEGSNVATGPDGEAVTDSFYFVHQPLAGNGSLTVGDQFAAGHRAAAAQAPPSSAQAPRTQPWAKAGILVKAGTRPGSPYAAIMVTPGHGVRMQYDFTHDIAGPAGPVSAASPKWLRLSRTGNTLTGYESADGQHWTTVGSVHLAGLPATVQAGLFVASPDYEFETQSFGGGDHGASGPTQATAVFGSVARRGNWPASAWTGGHVGPIEQAPGKGQRAVRPVGLRGHAAAAGPVPAGRRHVHRGRLGRHRAVRADRGSAAGDVLRHAVRPDRGDRPGGGVHHRRVPARHDPHHPGREPAAGPGAGRQGHRDRGGDLRRRAGRRRGRLPVRGAEAARPGLDPPVWPVWSLTSQVGVRVVVGTAALLAVTALLALAGGAILRRSAGAITAVIGLVIFPLVLSVILPTAPAEWVLRYTPAAAFSLQTSTLRYPQVTTGCIPYHGCYPLAPWTGFAVMCAWAVLALGVAAFLLRRRDA